MAESAKSRRERLKDEAAAWVVRLSDVGATSEVRKAFERWRSTSFEHELAYEREAATWARLDRLQALTPGQEKPDPDLLASRPAFFDTDEYSGPAPRWTIARRAAAGLIGLIGLGTALGLGLGLGSDPAYATAVGERRLVVLEDGSRVQLNTNSEIRVHFRHGKRVVELVRGEASFDVANGPEPFVIRTEEASVTAGPSDVTVRLKSGGASVAVREGVATVTPVDQPSGAGAIRVAAGYGGLFRQTGGEAHPIAADDMNRSLAWQQGAIALDGQPLAEAVAEFNRYNNRQMIIADRSIAAYRLGGYFRTDDIPGFVKALQATFPIRATSGPDGSVELHERGAS